jgi:hypothetical protein
MPCSGSPIQLCARMMNASPARAANTTFGTYFIASSAASRSTWKLSLPPTM